MKKPPISIQTVVKASMKKVWDFWNDPKHVVHWAFASDDWHAPEAKNDLKVGGRFKTVMAAKDGSMEFDFAGTYTALKENELIEYDMDDLRHVKIMFEQVADGVKVTQFFDPEEENSKEVQKQGWQAILDNFKKYTESK